MRPATRGEFRGACTPRPRRPPRAFPSSTEPADRPDRVARMSRPVLWLVRHGETEWSRDMRHTGRTDIPLTAAGEEQARELTGPLSTIPFDRVLCSPLARA